MGFKFSLSERVLIELSKEQGKVIGRAEYLTGEPTYFVRYLTKEGRAEKSWWDESDLQAVFAD